MVIKEDLKVKLSIIIPVYNAEKYISRCLDSIIQQKQKNYEMICINDASTDNSLKILKEYARKNKRIKILNSKINRKAGPSRVAGVKKAKGKYIWFVDADDYAPKNSLKNIFEAIKNFPFLEIGVFNYFFKTKMNKISKKKVNKKNYFKKILMQKTSSSLWNKVFEKKLIQREKMHNQFGEDSEFFYRVLFRASKIYFFQKSIYIYGLTSSSLTSNINKYNLEGNYQYIVKLKQFLVKKRIFEKYKKEFLVLKFRKYGYLLRKCWNSKEEFKQKIKNKVLKDKEINVKIFLKVFYKFPFLDLFFWIGFFISKKFLFKMYKRLK